MKNVKFAGFTIYEDGEQKVLSLEDLVEFQKQGYIIEIKLIKPAVIKDISIQFELPIEDE